MESFLDDCNVHAPGETDEEAFEREFELLEECFKRFMYWNLRLNGAKTYLNKTRDDLWAAPMHFELMIGLEP